MWIALFCLVGLGPAIAIRVVTRPASLAVEAAQDQSRTELALAPNEAAKADRLPLHDIRAETEVMPAAQPEPSETRRPDPTRPSGFPAGAGKMPTPERFPAKTCPGLDPGWIPVTKTRQTTNQSLRPGSSGTEKAPGSLRQSGLIGTRSPEGQ
jgi:hypothetical protein